MNQFGSVVGRSALVLACVAMLFACESASDEAGGTDVAVGVVEDAGIADGAADVTPEPDVAVEPDATEPDVAVEPDATEPDVAVEPDATEPDATEPDAMEPDATEPDAMEPDAMEPDATEPDATEPDTTEPDATEPDTTEPEASCLVAEDCTFTQFDSFVTGEKDCFCPMCPAIPVTIEVHNARSSAWSEHCSDWAAEEPCPVADCMDPGEATCSAGECVAVEEPIECMTTGCSGEICAGMEMGSTCDVKDWYVCLALTTCGNFGENDACAWEPSTEFLACMEQMKEGGGDPPPTCAEDVVCLAMPPLCPEGLTPVGNGSGCWGGCGFPETCSCDDGTELMCKMLEPVCAIGQVLATQNGCYACVDPMTCGVEPEPSPKPCGGFLGLVCDEGLECVDDPKDECDPNNGGADCPGICVEPDGPGGCEGPNPAGCFSTGCPDGQECVAEGCTSSSCECNEEAGQWFCTADCGGGTCVAAPGSCATDADCDADHWCRDTQDGVTECTPYKIEGESCGGFVPFWLQTKCLPGLSCEGNPQIPDLPGTCVDPNPGCVTDADCDADHWCRDTQDGGTECTPYQIEGESCGGFVPFWLQTKCLPGLLCEDQNPDIADEPGICVDPDAGLNVCEADDECTFTKYSMMVTQESDCFCPMCPFWPVSNAEHNARHSAWSEHCSQWELENPCPVPSCMDPGETVCMEGQCVEAPGDCFTTGCSAEICADMEIMSTCDIQPWYACLEMTSCGNFGENGTCAWEMTTEFEACLMSFEEPPACPTDGVMCKAMPPECPEGLTPVQDGICWGCGFPNTCSCDDGQPALCDMIPPGCAEDEVLATQGGCYLCVDPMTCAPPK